MKRLLRAAVRLYPGRWRQRYGRELEALLEDLEPDMAALVDVCRGAVDMHLRTISLPLIAALAGAVIGAAIIMWTPTVYASSATMRLKTADESTRALNPGSIERLLGNDVQPRDVLVTLNGPRGTTLTLSYRNADAGTAQRIAARMSAALASDLGGELISTAKLPTSPIGPNYAAATALGAVLGLALGGGAAFMMARRISARSQ